MLPSNLANVSVSMKGVLLRFVGCGGVVRGLCHGAYMCVCLRSLWDSPRSRVLRSGLASEALRVVLRGFVVLPLLTQGQLYAVYLFFTTLHRRRWVSLTYHEARRSGGPRPPCHRRYKARRCASRVGELVGASPKTRSKTSGIRFPPFGRWRGRSSLEQKGGMANERERVNEQKGAPPKLNSYIYEIDADESPIASTSHNGPTARASTELIGRVTLAWMTPCYPRVAVCFLRRPDHTHRERSRCCHLVG